MEHASRLCHFPVQGNLTVPNSSFHQHDHMGAVPKDEWDQFNLGNVSLDMHTHLFRARLDNLLKFSSPPV